MAVYDIPDYEFENLARSFLPAMEQYFSAAEGMAEYEKWLSEQDTEFTESENVRKTAWNRNLDLKTYPFKEMGVI